MRTAAKQTVIAYVKALDRKDFHAAYDLLSQASREQHTYAQFAQQGNSGITQLDLSTAAADDSDGNMVVSMQLAEDPGSHGFYLVREGGHWKIVYRGGSPGMPQPLQPTGGWQKGDTR
jgi:hypothetical protein